MKQPSDMSSYSHPTTHRNPRTSKLVDDEPPSISSRADHAAALLHDFARRAARDAAAGLRENVAAAARAVSVIEANTWSQIAAVLKDAGHPGKGETLSPEARLANAISLINLDDDSGIAQLNFDFHYALVSLAKANLMIARLEVLEEQAAALQILAPIEAEVSAIVDGLLDAIPDLVLIPTAEDELFAA